MNDENRGKKLIYILNQYSSDSAQHFYHIIHLLEVMAEKGVKIVLVIEKADGRPEINSPNIKVITQKKKNAFRRANELIRICKTYAKRGYRKVFIRISINAAVLAIISGFIEKNEVYYWQSGQTLEYDRAQKGFKGLKWRISAYSKLKFVVRFTDHFVTGPESMIDYYMRNLGIPRRKMLLLYNDIDTDRFEPASEDEKKTLRNELSIPDDGVIIVSVHRLSPVRKTEFYIPRIIEDERFSNNNAYLIIIGSGPDEDMIKEQVKNSTYNDRIRFLGSQPNNIIQKYYKSSDIAINPSYIEGFPRVVIEAMATGLPVVATDAGGTRDIVPMEEQEFIVSRDNADEFKEKLMTMVENKNLRQKLSAINRQYVHKYSTEKVADMYVEILFREDK